MLGARASNSIREQQLIWNLESQTPTILRMLHGLQMPTFEQWRSIQCPTLIICGEEVILIADGLTIGQSMSYY